MTIYQIDEHTKYMVDEMVATELANKRKLVNQKDRDFFILVSGDEGSGKSFLAFQLARFLNPKTNLKDNVAFNPEQLKEKMTKLKKGEVLIFDEAFTGLSSRSALSKTNIELVTMFMECRQRNLIFFIVLPSIFYLDKYVLLHRAKVLFHTYFKNEHRGQYALYPQYKIKSLELYGRKNLNMNVTKPRLVTRFSGYFAFDKEDEHTQEKLYRKMKLDSFKDKSIGESPVISKRVEENKALIIELYNCGYSAKSIAEKINQTPRNIRLILQKARSDGTLKEKRKTDGKHLT